MHSFSQRLREGLGASVMDDEILEHLLSMNRSIQDLAEAVLVSAKMAEAIGAGGVAFSCLMLRESLLAYCKAVNDFADSELD